MEAFLRRCLRPDEELFGWFQGDGVPPGERPGFLWIVDFLLAAFMALMNRTFRKDATLGFGVTNQGIHVLRLSMLSDTPHAQEFFEYRLIRKIENRDTRSHLQITLDFLFDETLTVWAKKPSRKRKNQTHTLDEILEYASSHVLTA